MCDTCGCGDPEVVPVNVAEKILADNDHRAAHNRAHFEEAGVLAINLMGSPGSGKTALLEATAKRMKERWQLAHSTGHAPRLGAVSGDLATDRDAARLRAADIASEAITTGSACHLDARLVHRALHDMPWQSFDLFFIENVGNLVCPAIYDLGQAANVVVLSVTEGADKPLKYPVMFLKADLVVLSKTDLLPHLPQIDVAEIEDGLARVNPNPKLMTLSAQTGEGLDAWIDWLEAKRAALPEHPLDHPHSHHHEHSL